MLRTGHRDIWLGLLVVAIFLSGYLDAAFFRARGMACATWVWGLVILTVWITFPPTTARVWLGAAVFMLGITLVVLYYKGSSPRARGRSGGP
jgi:tellurite resistance protein TehA-like permease